MIAALRFFAVVALVAGIGAAAAAADSLQDGTQAFAAQDYQTAMRLLAPLAESGDPVAGCMVAVMLDRTRGRIFYDADDMSATCIAAAGGQAPAELDLAGNYRTGLILEKDASKAAALYRRAADRGSPVAQKVLGDLYAGGLGVTRDLNAACAWWGRAALQGESSEAERNYGTCYLSGTGVARSEMKALAWWLVAKDHADASEDKAGLPGWVFQSEADADRLAVALMQRLPADQVAEAQAFARDWHPVRE